MKGMRRHGWMKILGLFPISFFVLFYVNAEPVGATYTLGFGGLLAICWGQLFGWRARNSLGFCLFCGALLVAAWEASLVGLFCALLLGVFCLGLWVILYVAYHVASFIIEWFGVGRGTESNPEEPKADLPKHPHSFWIWCPLLLVPCVEIESAFRPEDPTVCFESCRLLPPAPAMVWERLLFYDEVECEAPWILRLGLPTPLRTSGPLLPGQLQTCWYRRAFKGEGYVVKRGHTVIPLQHIGFEVVQQQIGFERSFRLLGAGYDLRAGESGGTELTIGTRYQARLQPRWVWQPVERYVLSQLHSQLIQGLQERIDEGLLHAHSAEGSRP